MKKTEKIKHIEKARNLIFNLAEIQDQIYENLIETIEENDNSDTPLWDYVYNGGEYAKKLFINTLK